MKCGNCGTTDGDFEVHHIVPRSRGGTDEVSNLQTLCVSCHGKVHNVEFSGSRGLIKHGIEKTKDKEALVKMWLIQNNDEILEFIYDFSQKHETNIVSDLLYFGVLYAIDLYDWIYIGKNRRGKYFANIPSMVRELYLSGDYNIPEIEFDDSTQVIN